MDINEEKFFDELMKKEKLRARPRNATETKAVEPKNTSYTQSIGNTTFKAVCINFCNNPPQTQSSWCIFD